MSTIFQDVKSRITCTEYARRVGLNINKSGDRTFSLDKGSNPSCLVVYDDYFHDFKLDISGDVIDLCAYKQFDGDKGQAIRELANITGIQPDDRYINWKKETQNLCNQIQLWHTQLRQQDREYLYSRNITDETINRLKIGFKNLGSNLGDRLIIPYFKNGYITYYIARGEKPKYWKNKLDGTICENTPWGLHTIKENKSLLVITEGAFDAISFEQEGYCVLSPMGGFFNKLQIKQVIDICKMYDEIFVCFDSDDSGQNFSMKISKMLFTNKINFSSYVLENVKDVNDYYVLHKNLDFINKRENGIEFLCKKILDKQEFKKFIKDISRYTAKTTMIDLFKIATVNFDKDWLNELKKQALSCPTEDMIVKEIKQKYNLKCHAGMFFEYKDGLWERQDEMTIKSYISKELGYYKTGSKVKTIYDLLAVECFSGIYFNEQNIFNFRNGVLNLDTGEFVNHSETFYSTMQVSYNYVPEIQPTKWIQFLKDITGNKPDKIALIQEMMGYILFSDVSLQKCFYLIGGGKNGKSKLLEIITKLFESTKKDGKPSEPKNISNVEMSELSERFERIRLLHSILNISTETSTDVAGSETIFKKAAVNEIINGAFKRKDSIDFIPKAKWIISCNNYIQPRDTSDGFDRRIIFIRFNIKFVDNPCYTNELQKDDRIVEKIIEELPAIFNWTYQGYKKLRKTMSFTETQEQEEIKKEFRTIVNPLISFISDFDEISLDGFISTKDLYKQYIDHCKNTGRHQMSFDRFRIAFKQTCDAFFPDYFEPYKTNTERGYKFLPRF